MLSIDFILPRGAAFDPALPLDDFLRNVPARWVVYLLEDAENRPVQLLCVKNLRYSLKRRLGLDDGSAPNKRVNYRDVVRHIRWRRVDSAFEADCVYLEAARALFPESYAEMTGFRPGWFIHVDPQAAFPQYTKVTSPTNRAGTFIGPLEGKQDAQRLIELVEDWFDLCRYHHILLETPHGRACAYKEMGKCPAPCDGSIGLDQYRRLVELSLSTLMDPGQMLRAQEARMRDAAAEMRFETAAKIKAFIDSLSQLGRGNYRYARRLADFQFLVFQRGPRQGTAKMFLVTPSQVEEIAGLISAPARPSELLHLAFSLSQEWSSRPADADAQRIGVVAHHLFQKKAAQGVFLALDQADEQAVMNAYRALLKQKEVETTDSEGIVKELQAL